MPGRTETSADPTSYETLADSLLRIATSCSISTDTKSFQALENHRASSPESQLRAASDYAGEIADLLDLRRYAEAARRDEDRGTLRSLSDAMFWPVIAFTGLKLGSAAWDLWKASKSTAEESGRKTSTSGASGVYE